MINALWARSADAVRVGARVAGWTEQQLLVLLRSRLDTAAPSMALSGNGPSEQRPERLDQKMRGLLGRALDQSTCSSQTELYHRLVDQLVPDEARILSALSDGTTSTVVHVHAWTRAGILGSATLENASLVGRTANLALPHLTSNYVGHLLALGLVELGPEDTSLKQDYEILMAETYVLNAIKVATRGPVTPRITRQTLRLTPLGTGLWAACTGSPA